jgi:hypothetical protein
MNFNELDIAKVPAVAGCGIRLWDDAVAWEQINTSLNVYNWKPLDEWIATAKVANRDVLYVFGRTPKWATTGAPCAYNAWCAGVPSDVGTTDHQWREFVQALVLHEKGKIQFYELWNEPNEPNSWAGTTAQLVTMAKDASGLIRALDPAAKVVSPTPTLASPQVWMQGYLAAGGASTFDIMAFHAYAQDPNDVLIMADALTALAGGKPLWMTEGSWGLWTPQTMTAQVIYVYTYHKNLRAAGIERVYWYAWDNTKWGTLTGKPAGQAYNELPLSIQ